MSEPHGNGVKVTTPAGSVEATGHNVVLYVLLLGLGVLIFLHQRETTDQHTQMIETMHRMTCVLAIDPHARLDAMRHGDPCTWISSRWQDDTRRDRR